MATPIGTLGTIPTLTVGGRVFTDLTTLKVLHASVSTDTRASTFRAEGATAGYPVTTAKTLTIAAINIYNISGNNGKWRFGYADNDVGFDSATALTNPIHMAASTDTGFNVPGNSATTWANNGYVNPLFPIPATKYFFVVLSTTSTSQVVAYGYET